MRAYRVFMFLLLTFLLFVGTSFANEDSLVGEKVNSEHTVFLSGDQTTSKAIMVKGELFFSETLLDQDLLFRIVHKDDSVYINKKVIKLGEPPLRYEDRIKEIDEKIKSLQDQKKEIESLMK